MSNTTDDFQELQALSVCVEALKPLSAAARARVLRYLGDRYPAPLLSGIQVPRRRASKTPPEAT